MEFYLFSMILTESEYLNFDGFVKSPKIPFSVIPAKAGIQFFQAVADHLDSGFHRSDDFLRDCQL